jgi:hypothetical protein
VRPNQAVYQAMYLSFPKGTYILDYVGTENDSAVNMKGMKNVTVDGNGSTFLTTDAGSFFFYECEDVTVRNVIIDSDTRFYSQGLVTAVNGNVVDIELEPGYEMETVPPILAFEDFDPVTRTIVCVFDGFPTGAVSSELLAPNKLRMTILDNVGNAERIEYVKKGLSQLSGKLMLLKHKVYGNFALDFYFSKNVLVEDCAVYSAGGFACRSGFTENTTFNRFRVEARPDSGRLVSVTADAIMCIYALGKVELNDCYIYQAGDDCFTAFNKYLEILEVLGDDKIRAKVFYGHEGPRPQPGDSMTFYDYRNLAENGKRIVKESTFDAKARYFTITFEEALPKDTEDGDCLVVDKHVSKLVLRNSVLGGGRGRGLLVENWDVEIDKCVFKDNSTAGIMVWAERMISVRPGPASKNVRITNTRFEDNGFSPLWIYSGCPEPGPAHENITVENCAFVRNSPVSAMRLNKNFPNILYYNAALYLSAVDTALIRNNTFEGFQTPIYVGESRNARIENNSSAESAKLLYNSKTAPDAVFEGNANMEIDTNTDGYVKSILFYNQVGDN